MKFKLYFFGVAGLLSAAALGIYSFTVYNTPIYQSMNYMERSHKAERADYNYMYYRMMRENPEGKLDFKEIQRARAEVAQFNSQKNPAASLGWDYIGPDYVGGRLRGLIQDNQTPNSSVMYAGSVSGGFFISFDGGEQWFDNSGNLPNLAISCLTQAANGIVFVGTGSTHEGGNSGYTNETGHPGDGLFRRDVSGNGFTFTRLIGPPTPNLPSNGEWRNINQIVAHPTNENRLYVGYKGLYYTDNAMASQPEFQVVGPTGTVDDIVISNSGEFIYYSIGGQIVKIQDNGSNLTVVNQYQMSGGTGSLGRIMLAISPDDNNILYAAVSNGEQWNQNTGCLYGIYQSKDAGITWKLIGPGGNTYTFDPYANPGTNCQGTYDNTVAVFPGNPGKIIVGGVQLWMWEESKNTSGVGGWSQIAVTQGGDGGFDPNYVHADKHRIVITSPSTIFIGSDGGVGKSIDGGVTWTENNFGLNVTQFYSIAAAPAIELVSGGQTYISEQVMGGSQDNGTQLIGINSQRPAVAVRLKGGDGFDCAFSALSNLAFATVYNGDLTRHSFGNFGGESFFDDELDTCNSGCGSFFTRFEYWERPYVDKTYDSVLVHIKGDPVNIGDSIKYVSAIGAVPMHVISTQNLSVGDSLMLPDFAQSKLAFVVGNKIYMTRDAAKLNVKKFNWDLIATNNSSSFPDPLSGSVFSMAFSSDGDHLYLGTTSGQIFRISNLKEGYDSLTLDIRAPGSVVTCTRIGSVGSSIITDIAVDPNDDDNLVATIGGFGRTTAQVFRVTKAKTALTNGATVVGIQGDLPNMPLYSAMIAKHDKNTVLVGTEFGMYGTDNAFTGTPTWKPANAGLPIVPVYRIVQQDQEYIYSEEYPWSKNAHYKKVYIGTCGRGFYRSTGLVGLDDKEGPKVAAAVSSYVQVKLYPNPVSSIGIIELQLPETQHTTIQIFDLNGRLVNTVYNSNLQGGKQLIEFDATKLHSGTYLASIRTNEGMKVSKFVVTR